MKLDVDGRFREKGARSHSTSPIVPLSHHRGRTLLEGFEFFGDAHIDAKTPSGLGDGRGEEGEEPGLGSPSKPSDLRHHSRHPSGSPGRSPCVHPLGSVDPRPDLTGQKCSRCRPCPIEPLPLTLIGGWNPPLLPWALSLFFAGNHLKRSLSLARSSRPLRLSRVPVPAWLLPKQSVRVSHSPGAPHF